MTWFDTGGNKPPFEPRPGAYPPKPRVPAPEPEQTDDEPMPDHQAEYRCEWCYGYLPADGLCRCPASLKDLEQERLEQRYELGKD